MMQKKTGKKAAPFHGRPFPWSWPGTGEGFLTMKLLFCVLGLLLIIEGLPYFACPDQMKKWMSLVLEIPSGRLRPIGLLAMGLGLFLAYLSRV
jgi:uncharacterized protein YjeT (DUF2065 family)